MDRRRLRISNVPRFAGFKQLRQFLSKQLPELQLNKLRQHANIAYVSLQTPEEARIALKRLDGVEFKKHKLAVALTDNEVERKLTPNDESAAPLRNMTAAEVVTPFAAVPYEEQLKTKYDTSVTIMQELLRQLKKTGDNGSYSETQLVQPILPSPVLSEYRNKNEFVIGKNVNGELSIGFVGGKFTKNQHIVVPLDDCKSVSRQAKAVVDDFTKFVVETGWEPFDEFERRGTFRMLTLREFGGEIMMIVSIFPLESDDDLAFLERSLQDKFLNNSKRVAPLYRVSSIYLTVLRNAGDAITYKHIAGAPFLYECLAGCRFRVSPGAFFQTNSRAAEVLLSVIAKSANVSHVDGSTVLLDICCGTGVIGQTNLSQAPKESKIMCIGIELVESAVQDAKKNAAENCLAEKCIYICAKAEDAFRSIKYYLRDGFSLDESNIVGILDPPRAGLQNSVIIGCRQLAAMKRLIYVSCEPKMALKNVVDLCRPTSNKFQGKAFEVKSIQPVDMFPHTPHVEWVITLER